MQSSVFASTKEEWMIRLTKYQIQNLFKMFWILRSVGLMGVSEEAPIGLQGNEVKWFNFQFFKHQLVFEGI